MRASLSLPAWTVAAALLVLPRPLAAQTPVPPKVDISGTVGWFANDRELPGGPFYDDDTQHRWVFGGDLGFYWTEHLKSEVGISATTTGSSFVLVPIAPSHEGAYPYASGHRRTSEVRVVAQQIWQFGHNAWVHPYVAAGVVVLREASRFEFDQPPLANPGPLVPPFQRAETVTRVKPVVSAGLKAYISPRAFVRGDILLSPWTTSRDVTVRGGIGVDLK
jgi:hypothetical protein